MTEKFTLNLKKYTEIQKNTLNKKKYTEWRTGSIRDKQVSMPLFFITLTSKKGNHI